MHKRLEAELVSLAHTILQMKNRNDAIALKEKAKELYERLSVLVFVEEYLSTTPNVSETKEELLEKIEKATEKKSVEIVKELLQVQEVEEKIEILEPVEVEVVKEAVEEKLEVQESVKDVVEPVQEEEEEKDIVQEAIEKAPKKQLTLEDEFKDSVSADVTTNLFTKAETKKSTSKASLNDKLNTNIQVGLNDRIAFVKHLFNHSQADFNRVLSQLNSFKTEKEAKSFIKKMVKPDYDWTDKEEFEKRFINLIERKFL